MGRVTSIQGADGVSLAFRTWPGTGPDGAAVTPIVLLHGLGWTAAAWDDVAPELAAATGRTVYAYDARGHGASSWPGTYSFELMRDDLLGFVSGIGVAGRVDVVGHSMGGVAGYLFAAAYPDRVRRLVLEEAPPPWPRPEVAAGPRPDGDLPYDWAVITAIKAQVNTPDPSWPGLLPSIQTPTLVLAGGPTSQVPQDRIATMAELTPSATLVTIEAGHRIHQTKPEAFLAEVVPFLRG